MKKKELSKEEYLKYFYQIVESMMASLNTESSLHLDHFYSIKKMIDCKFKIFRIITKEYWTENYVYIILDALRNNHVMSSLWDNNNQVQIWMKNKVVQ